MFLPIKNKKGEVSFSELMGILLVIAIVIGIIVIIPGPVQRMAQSLVSSGSDLIDSMLGGSSESLGGSIGEVGPTNTKRISYPTYTATVGACSNIVNVQNYNTHKIAIENAVKAPGLRGKSLKQALEGTGYSAEPLLAALITQEAGQAWDPRAVSPCGSAGLTQFIPATARAYGLAVPSYTFIPTCDTKLCGVNSKGTPRGISACNSCNDNEKNCKWDTDERFNAQKAIGVSAKYLADQIVLCKSKGLSVAYGVGAYNSGNCNGEANEGYVSKILGRYYPVWAGCINQ